MSDNTNPSAQSEESTIPFGDITPYSINEPGVTDPQPFKTPEDENVTTVDTLALAYPDGYVPEVTLP
jgi:hypothetical protein